MGELTHLDGDGHARMVDVGGKAVTRRTAEASATLRTTAAVVEAIRAGTVPKGDVAAVTRVAGIMAAKRTGELIPLCHPLPIDAVSVELAFPDDSTVQIRTTAATSARTGVEMEALTAASVAALALYDMCKALDKGIVIGPVQLEKKTGGKSGDWVRG